MDDQTELELLRDALDHIRRIANASRQPTNRLDWIAARARDALNGKKWDRNYLPEPNKASMQEVHDLRSTLFMLVRACKTENLTAIAGGVAQAAVDHPSLFRKHESNL